MRWRWWSPVGGEWWFLIGAAVAVLLTGTVLSSSLLAQPYDRDVKAGAALYARHCAACHGESGVGDGPSAAGFSTKPANLTDGRLMNPLPDEFLANVIRRGGPAEGLAPTMPAFERFLSDAEIRQVIGFVRSVASPAFRPEATGPLVVVPNAPAQPILFSHLVHAGSFQIACQYCHTDARRSSYAGLPSLERCMGCHKIVGAADNPEIRKIHEYWQRRESVPWVNVFKVPEFTYFSHKPHVRAGVACQTCHGPIERMRVVGAETGRSLGNDLKNLIGLHPPPRPLSMGWCVECHRRENTRGAHAPLDCVTCHH
jgi:mono/diheme cytochrome c family protein